MAENPVAHGPTLAAGRPMGVGPGGRLTAGFQVGEYVVESFLGAGAMGEVYAGHHPVIGKRVAIKVLRRDAAGSEAAERLVREAKATSQIDHPNVIDIFALGRLDDGRLYLVMDLVDGRSLRDSLQDGPLPPEQALPILDAIAEALDAAHARGVIHRDLKPDNIMISTARAGKQPRVHVLDFGLAKLIVSAHEGPIAPGTLTGRGTWLGTPGYMAPEQWSVDGAGPASDRYALGVIAFELLTGALPFSAASVPAMMEQHFRAAVPSVSSTGSVSLPAAVDAVFQTALAKDPEARYKTADAFVTDLRAALGAYGATARVRAPSRSRVLPALAGLAVLGGATFAAIATLGHGDERPPPPIVESPRPTGELALTVAASPESAEISFDGRVANTKPATLALKPGQRTEVRVRAPGYAEIDKTLTGSDQARTETIALLPISRFEGVWRLDDGALRALQRVGDQVDVFKLDSVEGERKFFRHYAFVPTEHGVAFADDDVLVDPNAPDDASCHVKVHTEYRYDPTSDALELRRDDVQIAVQDGHCVIAQRKVLATTLARVDGISPSEHLRAPAGNDQPPVPAKQPHTRRAPKQAPAPVPVPNQAAIDNRNDAQQAQNPPPPPAQQAQPQPQAPMQKQQQKL